MRIRAAQHEPEWQPQSEASTADVVVRVEVMFVPERSVPQGEDYFFAYQITIENHRDEPVQLTHRHWEVTDGNGMKHYVEGEGVVGEQPHLNPGDAFQYSSFCPLPTSYGTMQGHYTMTGPDGEPFDVDVPLFALSVPGSAN